MYKAGDFTNGKMNKIFKDATNERDGERYDSKLFSVGALIRHKQFGDFALVSNRTFAIRSARLYCTITGKSLEDFYSGFDIDEDGGDLIQLKKVSSLLLPFDSEPLKDWFTCFFMLTDRLGAVIDDLESNPCSKYLEVIGYEE